MYRIYKNILHSFPGGFKILVKSDILEEFYGSFPGVSRMIREVSHVYHSNHVIPNRDLGDILKMCMCFFDEHKLFLLEKQPFEHGM